MRAGAQRRIAGGKGTALGADCKGRWAEDRKIMVIFHGRKLLRFDCFKNSLS
jgi:hypothetical protein